MIVAKIKRFLYFPAASYFRFFAAIRLKLWSPKVLVVTGSNGKTTLLHMLESQIGDKARYSHHANSSFGIPFDILDLHRRTLLKSEWFEILLKAPLNVFKKLPNERLYVVEADCDRPGEGKFLASLLHPSVTLWVSTAKTHSMYFEHLVASGKFLTVEDAIAYEFGYFLEYTNDMVFIDGDSELMRMQIQRSKAKIIKINTKNNLKKYEVSKSGTKFKIASNSGDGSDTINFKFLLPEEVFYSIEICRKVCNILNIQFDQSFYRFKMPPGRGSIFTGIKNITIVDSSYNANLSSMKSMIEMFNKFPEKNKWVVVGDMLEQGEGERKEHEKLAELLCKEPYDRIILLGPRVKKYTLPKLKDRIKEEAPIDAFENPRDVLAFILAHIKGDEVILFKGARFMEGIIEHLLKDKSDVSKLSRREKIWDIRRRQWGL